MSKKESSPYSAVGETMKIARKASISMGRVEDNPKLAAFFETRPTTKGTSDTSSDSDFEITRPKKISISLKVFVEE